MDQQVKLKECKSNTCRENGNVFYKILTNILQKLQKTIQTCFKFFIYIDLTKNTCIKDKRN